MAGRQLSPEEEAKLHAAAAQIRAGKKQGKTDRKELRKAPPTDTVANFIAFSQVLAGEVDPPKVAKPEKADRPQRTAAPSLLKQAAKAVDTAIDEVVHEVQDVVDTVKATAQVITEEE